MPPLTLRRVKIVPLLLAAASFAGAVVLYQRGRRWSVAGLLLAGAVLGVYGSGVIELPSLESILEDLGERLGPWTYLVVGVLAFLETSAFVGLVAPGELAVVFGGFVAGQGKIDPVALWLVVWFAAAAGDSTGYLFGRRLGRGWALRYGERVGVTPGRFEAVERFFGRHGGKTIIIGRFIGFVRALAPFVAGASRVHYGRFLAASLAGAGLWSAAFVALGYIFWRSFSRALDIAKQGNIGFLVFVVLVALVVAVYRLGRHPESRAELRRRLRELLERF
jgi:membrane protein DedA with SNARE-associated domain